MLPDTLTHRSAVDLTIAVADPATGGGGYEATVGGHALVLLGADDLEPGRYHLTDAVAYDLDAMEQVVDWLDLVDPSCPDCGGSLAYDPPDALAGLTPSSDAAGALVVTDGTSVAPVDEDGPVDDWRGRPGGGRQGSTDPWSLPIEVRCVDCGRRFDLSEHAREQFYDHDSDADADHARASAGDAANLSTAVSPDGPAMASQQSLSADAELGMATGGAKDAANFRDNVAAGYVPHPDAMSYEGLFYDYYFDTGEAGGDTDALFYPSYAAAVTEDPLSGDVERYLTVGLNSTLSTADFERKRLNLVAVLDVSGSMSSGFSEYYYDRHGRQRETGAGEASKMEAASEALASLTTHLDDGDRLGVVLYNSRAHVAKPLRDVGSTDMDAIRGHIREVRAGGGTDLSAGFREGRQLLADVDADPTEVENRIVFLTDMMPNLGEVGEDDLVGLVEDAAQDGVYTTFVGVGLDANPELGDAISAVRGANHYFVHSAEEFARRLDEEFAYMVTPLVFDLSLDVVADGYELAGVYGSPDADAATGEVMHVPTLFPSPTREGETRGGVVLLELAETGPDPELDLVASWVERDGSRRRDTVSVEFPADAPEQFETDGVRKAVLLARYAGLLRDWSRAVRDGDDGTAAADAVDDWRPPAERERGEWEQESVPLHVPEEYAALFEQFRAHLRRELDAIGDGDLQQELDVLDDLLDAA